MADVKRPRPPAIEMQEFVHRSAVRSGLKREFAFALKAQTEMLVTPMSRTRSGKILHSSGSLQIKSRKKKRKLEAPLSLESPEEFLSVSPVVSDGLREEELAKAFPNPDPVEESASRVASPVDAAEIPITIPILVSSCSRTEIAVAEVTSSSAVEVQRSVEIQALPRNPSFRNPSTKHVTYFRRFHRSVLNSEVKDNVPNSTPSTLKTLKEDLIATVADEPTVLPEKSSSTAVEEPAGREEAREEIDSVNRTDEELATTTANEALSTTPKKLNLKFSKISLTKIPSTVKNLLETGLLEGLNVKYITRAKDKEGGLRGVVKDGKILCFCNSCQGLNTVTAYNFELHAGSTKKHPSDYIYLENGSTMRDVLRACVEAPLETLELTIRSAISADCDVGPSNDSRVGRLTPVCESCFVSRLSRRKTKKSLDKSAIPKISKSILPLKSPDSNLGSLSSQKKSNRGRMTTKDLRLHKLVFTDGILPDGTEVAYYARGKRLLQGYIQGNGIFCLCCNSVISPSQFEAHAGCPSRRKPYLNIYTSNGVSLHELSISLSKDKRFATSENDDLCGICADGGDLLLCDICPRAFHKECVGLTSVPEGDWYCPYCQNRTQKEKSSEHNENAIAAGRIAGVDPIEQIIQRCIRIVKSPESDLGGCVLCRAHDFCKSGFGPRTVLLCDQCEREFHVGCLKEHGMGDFKELPEGTWFCSPDCNRIHTALQRLLAVDAEQLTSIELDIIKEKQEKKGVVPVTDVDMKWRLLSGKTATPDTRLLLSKALSLFHECFDPIIDIATGKDLIPAIVYGRDAREQEFGGMFCSVLTVNSSVVSAGILRVMGCEVAELPLVATNRENQGQGYFQAQFSCIERMLNSLGVKHLVLPAAEEAESIWTQKFGFSKISVDELNALAKGCRPTVFHGTSMLHKLVSRPPNSGVEIEGDEEQLSALSLSSPPPAIGQ
ncbi:uncharacterized protein LOC144700125 [Wolffia australiana]